MALRCNTPSERESSRNCHTVGSAACRAAISSASGSNTRMAAALFSMTMSTSYRSSSHLNSASSYWFLRMLCGTHTATRECGKVVTPPTAHNPPTRDPP